jgi:hypothetical protein
MTRAGFTASFYLDRDGVLRATFMCDGQRVTRVGWLHISKAIHALVQSLHASTSGDRYADEEKST